MPDTIELSDEQFYSFLEKAVANDFGKRTLDTLKLQDEKAPQSKGEAPMLKTVIDTPNDNTAEASQAGEAQRSGGN